MTKPRPRLAPPASSGRSGTGSVREKEGTPVTHAQGTSDAFFRHIVSGMRNAVLAMTRDGRLALINDEAYRVFGITPHPDDLGQPQRDGSANDAFMAVDPGPALHLQPADHVRSRTGVALVKAEALQSQALTHVERRSVRACFVLVRLAAGDDAVLRRVTMPSNWRAGWVFVDQRHRERV